MSASTVLPDLMAVSAICREHRVRSLDPFGSAATGRFDPILTARIPDLHPIALLERRGDSDLRHRSCQIAPDP